MKDNSSAAVAGQMTLVFIVLRLAEQITWDWLWILSPAWIFMATTIAWSFIAAFIPNFIDSFRRARRR